MSAVVVNEVRCGFYVDSVALMRLSADLVALPGIEGRGGHGRYAVEPGDHARGRTARAAAARRRGRTTS